MPILKKVGFVIYNYYIHIYKCSMLIVLSATSVLPVPVHHVFQGPPCNVESEVSNKSPADLAGREGGGGGGREGGGGGGRGGGGGGGEV